MKITDWTKTPAITPSLFHPPSWKHQCRSWDRTLQQITSALHKQTHCYIKWETCVQKGTKKLKAAWSPKSGCLLDFIIVSKMWQRGCWRLSPLFEQCSFPPNDMCHNPLSHHISPGGPGEYKCNHGHTVCRLNMLQKRKVMFHGKEMGSQIYT